MSFYRFNNLSGKIVNGAQRLGSNLKSGSGDAPQIIFESSKVKFPTITNTTAKARRPGVSEMDKTLLKNYSHYQADNGVPIHLKGGSTDVAMYYITLVGCAIGTIECFRYYYGAAFPKKPE